MALTKVKGSGLATGAATASLVGIDDNATSTAITIDASENLTLAAGGTTYGKIGSSAGTYIASVACGLRLHSGGTKIFPTDANGGALPNAVDLGAGGGEWKDLYLSGNVKMASGKGIDFSADANATGATSEVLDDYEEGTWTPDFADDAGNLLTNPTSRGGTYVKVGGLVYVAGSIRTQTTSSTAAMSGNLKIAGLPFTRTGHAGHISFHTHESGSYNAPSQLPRDSVVSGTGISMYKYSGTGGRTSRFAVTDLSMSGNSNYMFFSGTYEST